MKLFTKRSGITINVSTEAVVRTIIIGIIAVMILKFIGQIGHQLQLIATSAFLALALNPIISGLSKRFKIKSRVKATGIAYLIVMVILIGFLSVVVPPLVKQTVNFLEDVPRSINSLKTEDSAVSRAVQKFHIDDQIDKFSNDVGGHLSNAPSTIFNTAGRVGGTLVSLVTVLVLTFMMLAEGPLWLDRMWQMMPEDKRKHRKDLAHRMYKVVTGYVNGQVLIAFIAALFALVTLLIASAVTNSPVNAVALAGIVFMFGLIPLIGNTLAAVVVIVVCLFTSAPLAIIMAVYFLLYQQIENATLQPYIQAKSNQLTPLIVFIAALIGAGFGGILGAFVAIPTAGCLRILFEDRYGKDLPSQKTVEETTTN